MTQTLTTERLREIAIDGFLEHGDAKLMARELLANREAQPVAVMYKDGHVLTKDECGNAFDICCRVQTPLYAAPPAPVVNPEFTGATAVPEDIAEIIKRFQHQCNHLSEWHHIDEHSCKVDRRDLMIATEFLNACRAAILAQPVSQGCKLVPVEPTPKQWAAGLMAIDTGMDKVTLVYKAMLAAAPEGGK